MNRTFFLSITFVAIVFGMMLGCQFRSTSAGSDAVPRDREQELVLEKKSLIEDVYGLQHEIYDLSIKLEEAGIGQKEADEALARELTKIKRFAGLSKVSGPGVELVIELGKSGLSTVNAPKSITDEHLLKLINELFSAGAEAVAINGQRITSTSEVRQAGNHINVNGTPLSNPYHIFAIGDVSALKSRLDLKGGLVEYLIDSGILVEILEQEEIMIPSYTGGLYFEYAKPVVQELT